MAICSQNRFSRVSYNDMKMGAYYTDLTHCRDIGKMFAFPEKEVSVLEPSIGDASAVIALTGAKEKRNIKIFGVELNEKVSAATKKNPHIEACLTADFLEGVRIKNNAFSFCFGNPPYQKDNLTETGTKKTEYQFLEKVTIYLMMGGLLCWVIPHRSFLERSTLRFFLNHYEILCVEKFRKEEFEKFKQVVVVARKIKPRFCLLEEIEQAGVKYSLERLLEVSDTPRQVYEVMPSEAEKINLFCTKRFDEQAAYQILKGFGKTERFSDISQHLDEQLSVPPYQVNQLGSPPIPLKKDSLYLLATSGAGQGVTGSVKNKDLHLQRGVAEVIEDSELITDSTGEVTSEKVTTRTKITITVIENNGKITVLE